MTLREVEIASAEIAKRKGDQRYEISIGAISNIENNNVIPTLHKVFTLASTYHLKIADVFDLYGIGGAAEEPAVLAKTHLSRPATCATNVASKPQNSFVGATGAYGEAHLQPEAYAAYLFHGNCKY